MLPGFFNIGSKNSDGAFPFRSFWNFFSLCYFGCLVWKRYGRLSH